MRAEKPHSAEMMSVSEKFRDRSALGISNECDRVTIFKIVSPCRCASLPASRNSLSGVFRKTSDVKSFPCQYIQVTCETLVTIFFLTELSHVLPHTPKSSLKQHALNQRSPARSGIENRWPKGKAKVKGIGGSFFRPNCFVHWPNIHLWNRSQFCKLILFIETYCAVIRGMPSSYCQEDATSISLVSSHRSYFFN